MDNISLCQGCGCMTKNIRQGHTSIFKCGKCGYFKQEEIIGRWGKGYTRRVLSNHKRTRDNNYDSSSNDKANSGVVK